MRNRNGFQNCVCPFGGALRFFALPEDDSDVKIFSGSRPTQTAPAEDDGADEFVRERDNGNLERAKQIGLLLARKLAWLRRLGDSQTVLEQKKVLFSYTAAKVIGQRCPSSLLAQAALGEFYRWVKTHLPQDYDRIQDSVAFTKYLLSQHHSDMTELGCVFADLCGRKADTALQRKGIQLYYRYTSDCMTVCNRIHFV